MAVYSIKNLHSEELNDRIALVESYNNMMNDDCSLFREQIMNEANIASIGKSLKDRIDAIIKKAREIFKRILESVKGLLKKLKEKVRNKAYDEKLTLFLRKVEKKAVHIQKSYGLKPPILDPFSKMLSSVMGYSSGDEKVRVMMMCIDDAEKDLKRDGAVNKKYIEDIKDYKDKAIQRFDEAIEKSDPQSFFFYKDTPDDFYVNTIGAEAIVENLRNPDIIYDEIKGYFEKAEKRFKEYAKDADEIDRRFKEEASKDTEDKSGMVGFLKELSAALAEIVSATSKYDTTLCMKITSTFSEYINTLNKIVNYGLVGSGENYKDIYKGSFV